MQAGYEDPIDYIDKDKREIHFKSGFVDSLSEDEHFALTADQGQKDIREGVKETELQFDKGISNLTGSQGVNTLVKNLSDNVFSRLATDYIADPIAAGIGAISPREGQEEQGFFDRLGGNYVSQRMGRRDARKVMDQENPNAALAGKVGSVGIDLAMPLGKLGQSPTAVGALFGAGSSDRSLFEDPGEFAKSTAGGAALGFGLGKAGNALERVAGERRAIKGFPKLEKEAEKAHQQKLKNFRSTVKEKIGATQKDIGKFGISKEAMDLESFINREIGVSGIAGSREAKELDGFLRNLEGSLPETIQSGDLQRLYEAIEVRTASGVQAEAPILQAFKEHLVERLPIGAAQNKLMGKVFPKVERETVKIIDQAFEKLPKNVVKEIEIEFGKGAINQLKDSLRADLTEAFGSMNPNEFLQILESGDGSIFLNSLTGNQMYQNMANLPAYKALQNYPGQPQSVINAIKNSMPSSVFEAEARFQNLPSQIQQKVENVMKKNALDASLLVEETQKKIASRLSNATGVQNPYVSRQPTNVPVGAYQAPQRPQVGAMANRFETQPLGAGKSGSEAFGLGALGKLVGLPKVGAALAVGKGARVGLEGTLRGLTSPSALGNLARQTMKGSGMKLMVEQISSNYPSYEKGIIADPQERKLAVSEIETDSDIEIEDKAMLQAYINRGKNLELLIRE